MIQMEDNPFERDTQMIKNKDALADLGNVRKIMLESKDKRFDKIIEFIDTIFQNPDKQQFYPESLPSELKYMRTFYQAISGNQVPQNGKPEQFKDKQLKLIQLTINMKMKKGEPVSDSELKSLYQIVKKNPGLKQQVMMKTVGCKSIKRMVDISKEQIDDLTSDISKRAIKYQIASDWKFIVGAEKQALQFKTECVKLWGSVDKLARSEQAKQQLHDLTTICNGKKVESLYISKLKTMRLIVCEIQKIPPLSDKQKLLRRKKKIAIQRMIPKMLEQLQLTIKQTPKDNKNMSASTLKKRGIIQQRRQIGQEFMKNIQTNNFAYCQILPDNRFQHEQIYALQKCLGVFTRYLKKRYRDLLTTLSALPSKKGINEYQDQKIQSKMKKSQLKN